MPATAVLPQPVALRPSPVRRVWLWLLAALAVGHERRELRNLDDHLLADIGLDRHSVEVECSRAFWDLPQSAWPR